MNHPPLTHPKFLCLAIALSCLCAPKGVAQSLLKPQAKTLGKYFPIERAFDGTEPSLPPAYEQGQDYGQNLPMYQNRWAYLDFGEDYYTWHIDEIWTLFRSYSGGDQQGFQRMWWDDDLDLWNDSGAEADLPLLTAQQVSNINQPQWVQNADYSSPLVPKNRYLIVQAGKQSTQRAMEIAFVGEKKPETPPPNDDDGKVTAWLPKPDAAFDLSSDYLVDEILFGNDDTSADFQEHADQRSYIGSIYGKNHRLLPPDNEKPQYFSYRIGKGKSLQPNKPYVLVVEYPQDKPRAMFISNSGNDSIRGFHTGNSLGDAMAPPYVNPQAESLSIPLTGKTEQWTSLFYMHQRLHGVQRFREPQPRHYSPEDGIWVTISVLPSNQDPTNAGAAISRIALYEVPDSHSLALPLPSLPASLPKRRNFWREEMADVAISSPEANKRGLDNPVDWFRQRAKRAEFLGFNTFGINLLEFGHTQYWDNGAYPGWFNPSQQPWVWENVLSMMTREHPQLTLLPYYEYAGGDASNSSTALGRQKRAEPLTRDKTYTHVWWSESLNVDITDPETYLDAERLLEQTIFRWGGDEVVGRPVVTDNNVGNHHAIWFKGYWGYIDLGEDYQQWRITQSWTRSRRYHGGPATPYQNVYWSNSLASFQSKNTNIPSSAIKETALNFITQNQSGGSAQWSRDLHRTTSNAITPKGRYLLLQTPDEDFRYATELALVGYRADDPQATLQRIQPHQTGATEANKYSFAPLFDAQPSQIFQTKPSFAGTWFRPRVSDMPVSFAEATRERYRQDRELLITPTKQDLLNDSTLKNDYHTWWLQKRRDFLEYLQQRLEENIDNASLLFTFDATETGASNPLRSSPSLFTDNTGFWHQLGRTALHVDQAIHQQWQWEALTHPVKDWTSGDGSWIWEWGHAVPAGDPWNYQQVPQVLQTYSFNRAFSVLDAPSIAPFRTDHGLAMVRHFALNENVMEDQTGYFVADMERTGQYSMLAEARAVASGDPTHLGYLSSGVFNSGSPGYVRAFNAAYLALPALPSERLPQIASHNGKPIEDVVVRKIETDGLGTYLAVVNIGLHDLRNVTLQLPSSGSVIEVATQQAIPSVNQTIELNLWAGQLRTLVIQ